MEEALSGRTSIARKFGRTSPQGFFAKHGRELHRLGIIFYSFSGKPRRKRLCAFESELVRWASFKARRGEVI